MDLTMSREIDAAVTWWTDQLRNKSERTRRNLQVMGQIDAEQGTTIGQTLVSLAHEVTVDDDLIARFGVALRRMIQERVRACPPICSPDPYYYIRAQIRLGVDYDPWWLIADAWEEAGGDYYQGGIVFPNKTTMRVNPGEVVVNGYGGTKTICAAPA